MNRLSNIVVFFGSLAAVSLCSGEDPSAKKNRSIRIKHGIPRFSQGELCVLDGNLMFLSTFEDGKRPGGPDDPRLPDLSLAFVWEGQMLRATIVPVGIRRDRDISKKLLGTDGWYITADFSNDPPQVILTEKPTEHSRWTLVDSPYGARKFLKNDNAPGKAAWLAVGADAQTYRGGIARTPILTEQKDYFWIGDADSGK